MERVKRARWKSISFTGGYPLSLKEGETLRLGFAWHPNPEESNIKAKVLFLKYPADNRGKAVVKLSFLLIRRDACQPASYISGCNKGHRKGWIIFKPRLRSLNTFSIRWLMKMGTPFARVRVARGTITLIWRSVHMRACAPCRSGLASN